jgi:hypothetical protein
LETIIGKRGYLCRNAQKSIVLLKADLRGVGVS